MQEGGTFHNFEFLLKRRNGTTILTSCNIRLVKNTRGEVLGTLGALRDISALKRMEAELVDSKSFNKAIVDSYLHCIKILDEKGHLRFMNEGGQKLLEIEDIKPFIGRSWIEFWQEEDQPRVTEAIAKAVKGEIGQFEAFCPTVAGNPKWWDVIITHFDVDNISEKRLLAVSRDITERKKTEVELLEKNWAIESDMNAIAFADMNTNLTYVNTSFLQFWGYAEKSEVIGRSAVDFWETPQKADEIIEAIKKGKGWTGEMIGKRRDGQFFPVRIVANMIVDSSGEPVCMQASFQDISRQKELETSLQKELQEKKNLFLELQHRIKTALP
jgi:PAS domain S-box-containing protein